MIEDDEPESGDFWQIPRLETDTTWTLEVVNHESDGEGSRAIMRLVG
ncbi:hypothetical protein RE411_21955 [Agrobacterium pusense]|nr:hypothetical protein [Agrobacterium pusense]WMW58603.1 hypothetical protein RE411_21955 [Agrobacterium pusense]